MSTSSQSPSQSPSSPSPSPSKTSSPPSTSSSNPPANPSPTPSTHSSTSSSSSPSSSAPSSVSSQSTSSTTSTTTSSTSTVVTTSITTTSAPPATSSPTFASTSASTSLVIISNSDGIPVTSTQVVISTPTTSLVPSSPSDHDSDKGFFQNTGAVAGTFTAVGVVGLAFLVFLVTYIIRRRRQAKFDREVNEATLEAANASAPPFLDTNDGYDGYDGAGGVYSDASSHGTYAQPPMSTEAYGMREIGPGVAGVGISMAPGYGHGYEYDQYPPAAAYVRPQQAQVYADYAQAQAYPQDPAYHNANSTMNLYAADAGYAYPDHAPRSPSQGHGQSTSHEGHAAYYHPQSGSPEHQLLQAAGLDSGPPPGQMQRGMSLNHNHSREHENEQDAYGGYVAHAHDEYEHAGDDRGSYYEEVEAPRVLKIANA